LNKFRLASFVTSSSFVLTSSLVLIAICAASLSAVPALSQEAESATSQAQGGNPIVRMDPALDALLDPNAKVEKVKGGFDVAEGPVWVRKGGYLLLSDINANSIYKWTPKGDLSVFLDHSGYTGTADPDVAGIGAIANNGHKSVKLIGSNGLTLDLQGRVVFCAQGDRSVVRLEKDGKRTVMADHFEGKRLNSPNDLVYRADGTLYFTDHISGLRGRRDDPHRELNFQGVFMVKDGKIQLAVKDLFLPNGLAFSPDQKILYIANNNPPTLRHIMRYDVQPDGSLVNGKLFIDLSSEMGGNFDGIKVDKKGNIYATGPGGIWFFSPQGKTLGSLKIPEPTSNLTFGDSDGKTLYMTARTAIYRIRTKIPGIHP
jgi:gluconolactonase